MTCHRYDVKTENQQRKTTAMKLCHASSVCVDIVCTYNCPCHILLIGQYRSTIASAASVRCTAHIQLLHGILINRMQWKINFPMINTERKQQTNTKQKICKLESTNYNNNRLVFPPSIPGKYAGRMFIFDLFLVSFVHSFVN